MSERRCETEVGIEAGATSQEANEVSVAHILRENQLLRSVADAAIRLREAGRAYDQIQEGLEKLWSDNPQMTKSGTLPIMANQAFETAMQKFDDAVLEAFEAGMDWAKQPELGPREHTPRHRDGG